MRVCCHVCVPFAQKKSNFTRILSWLSWPTIFFVVCNFAQSHELINSLILCGFSCAVAKLFSTWAFSRSRTKQWSTKAKNLSPWGMVMCKLFFLSGWQVLVSRADVLLSKFSTDKKNVVTFQWQFAQKSLIIPVKLPSVCEKCDSGIWTNRWEGRTSVSTSCTNVLSPPVLLYSHKSTTVTQSSQTSIFQIENNCYLSC